MGSLTDSSTTQKAEPWGPTAKLLKQGYGDLANAYSAMGHLRQKDGTLKSNDFVFTEPTTVAPGVDSMAALDGMRSLAAANSNGSGMSGPLQQIMSNGGFTGGQTDAISGMKGLASNGMLNQLINGNGLTADQNRTFDNLKSTVANNNGQFTDTFNRGGFDERQAAAYGGLNDTVNRNNAKLEQVTGAGGLTADQRGAMDRYTTQATTAFDMNPDFLKVRQSALDKQADALSARAASAGRYGGGMDQAILAREQGDLTSRMNVDQMLNDQNQKNIANAALMSGGQQAVGNQIGVNSAQQQGYQNLGTFGQIGQGNQLALNSAQIGNLGAESDMAQRGVTNNSNAIGQKQGLLSSIFNSEQAGLGNMSSAYDTATKPLQTQAQVGGALDQAAQNVRNDEMRMFDATNPMNNIQGFLSTLLGAPRNSTTTSSASPLQTLLGAGIGGYGLLNGMGMFGAPTAAGAAPG